jgi:hypothetical protein
VAVFIEVAVLDTAGVGVTAYDLTVIIDPFCEVVCACSQRIVEGSEFAVVVQKAVLDTAQMRDLDHTDRCEAAASSLVEELKKELPQQSVLQGPGFASTPTNLTARSGPPFGLSSFPYASQFGLHAGKYV